MATNINSNTALVQVDVRTTMKTVTLPTAASFSGRLITIKDKYANAFVNNISVQPQSGDTIDGSAFTYVLSNTGAAVTLVSDGANRWMTLNSPATPFTGSTIYLSATTVNVAAVRLIDQTTAALSNLTVSSGILYLASNAVFSGQLPLLSSIQTTFSNAVGYTASISSLTTSTLTTNLISAPTFVGATFIGDGSRLSNLFVSSTVLQAQYSFFTVSSATQYSSAPWGSQLVKISTIAQQASLLSLSNDGFTLIPAISTSQVFRISYMTGGNQLTTAITKPTLTMAISTATSQVFYPSVENFEGGGGSVTFLETLNSTSQVQFFVRGLSNYTFTAADSSLYRISFETVSGTGTSILSTTNVWGATNRFAAPVQFDNTITVAGVSEVQILNASNAVLARTTLTVQGTTLTAGITNSGDITTTGSVTAGLSSIAASIYTTNLRTTASTILGSVVIANSSITATNATLSSLTLYDQSTMTFKAMTISSGAIYVGGVLASAAGGGGGGGAGGSTISSLYVGSSSNENFIKFWGRIGEYENTVISDQSTGTTSAELLVFKGSSISDQIRFQTTGAIKFETGVGLRNFVTETALTTPTMTITANSNVGIGTNNPQFNLDVAGTSRFQTLLSTSAVYTGALYMSLYFA